MLNETTVQRITKEGTLAALLLAKKIAQKPKGYKIHPGDENVHSDMKCLRELKIAKIRTEWVIEGGVKKEVRFLFIPSKFSL